MPQKYFCLPALILLLSVPAAGSSCLELELYNKRKTQLLENISRPSAKLDYLAEPRQLDRDIQQALPDLRPDCRDEARSLLADLRLYYLDEPELALAVLPISDPRYKNNSDWIQSRITLKKEIAQSPSPDIQAEKMYRYSKLLERNGQAIWWRRHYLQKAIATTKDFPDRLQALFIEASMPGSDLNLACEVYSRYPNTPEAQKIRRFLAMRAPELTEAQISGLGNSSPTDEQKAFRGLLLGLHSSTAMRGAADLRWELSKSQPAASLDQFQKVVSIYPRTYAGGISAQYLAISEVDAGKLESAFQIATNMPDVRMSYADELLRPRALFAVGDAFVDAGQLEKAKEAYSDAVKGVDRDDLDFVDSRSEMVESVREAAHFRLAKIAVAQESESAEGEFQIILSTYGYTNSCAWATDGCVNIATETLDYMLKALGEAKTISMGERVMKQGGLNPLSRAYIGNWLKQHGAGKDVGDIPPLPEEGD